MENVNTVCLGPLLFFMYLKNLSNSTDFDITAFEDDTHLSLYSESALDSNSKVNKELTKVDR